LKEPPIGTSAKAAQPAPTPATPPVATPPAPPAAPSWTTKDAEKLYNIQGWGQGYFRVNPEGHVAVHPGRDPKQGLDLFQLALDLEAQGVRLPLLVRFSDILKSRLEMLAEAFASARKEFGYEGSYTTVYPIKVNQQRHVVEEIVEFGTPLGVGLECGSKPELQAVLGLSEGTDHIIVCNGYKDEEFLRLAMMGQKLGHDVFIVVEQLNELESLLRVAAEIGVKPNIGVRIKLATEGSGRWAKSGGERSKFGLNATQLTRLCARLEAEGMKDQLRLVHFHLGSQITDIRFIKAGLEEVGRFYSALRKRGFNITHVDVGGGLGVDYDGSRSTRPASMNYTMREYANDIVYTLGQVCKTEGLPHPNLISESGRATTAHHALLLINVIDVETQQDPVVPAARPDAHPLLKQMQENLELAGNTDNVVEAFHDTLFLKERAQELFVSGVFTLQDRADAEQLYLCTVNAVAKLIGDDKSNYSDIQGDIEGTLVDRYFCNFSLFQSLPDSWAIDQLFPIMPIHRLGEPPVRKGTLQDITCDSDGTIDRFAGGRKGKPALELHPLLANEPYILGVFLTGAYQEILGDLHNLFGDTNAVHVRMTQSGVYEVTDLVRGDTVTEVLQYVQFQATDLLTTFRRKVSRAQGLDRNEANAFIADYIAGLEGYTYLEDGLDVQVSE
jgi:arginine decarboxylase